MRWSPAPLTGTTRCSRPSLCSSLQAWTWLCPPRTRGPSHLSQAELNYYFQEVYHEFILTLEIQLRTGRFHGTSLVYSICMSFFLHQNPDFLVVVTHLFLLNTTISGSTSTTRAEALGAGSSPLGTYRRVPVVRFCGARRVGGQVWLTGGALPRYRGPQV